MTPLRVQRPKVEVAGEAVRRDGLRHPRVEPRYQEEPSAGELPFRVGAAAQLAEEEAFGLARIEDAVSDVPEVKQVSAHKGHIVRRDRVVRREGFLDGVVLLEECSSCS